MIHCPLDFSAPWQDADEADLLSFDWRTRTAEFSTCDKLSTVRVHFDTSVIVRMLDEFPLCTEAGAQDRTGFRPHHFAYRVEGDPFYEAQSAAWREVEGSPVHYRFLTGAGCLDVISSAAPQFAVAKA